LTFLMVFLTVECLADEQWPSELALFVSPI